MSRSWVLLLAIKTLLSCTLESPGNFSGLKQVLEERVETEVVSLLIVWQTWSRQYFRARFYSALCQTNQTSKNVVFQPSPVVALQQELQKKVTNDDVISKKSLLVADSFKSSFSLQWKANKRVKPFIGFLGEQIAKLSLRSAHEV